MTKTTPLTLDEHFIRSEAAQVDLGRFNGPSEVVRAEFRLLEERETRLEALRVVLIEGEHSGPSTPFDFESFIARKRASQPPAA